MFFVLEEMKGDIIKLFFLPQSSVTVDDATYRGQNRMRFKSQRRKYLMNFYFKRVKVFL